MTSDSNHSEPNASQLPALHPQAALVLRRTQTALGLLHNVVQESSAEYWFAHGRAAEAVEQWAEAVYAYQQCVERKASHWRGIVRMAAVLGRLGQAEAAAKALTEASEATLEGCYGLSVELDKSDWQMLFDCLESARSTARDGFGLLLGLALVCRAWGQYDKTRKAQARQIMDAMQSMQQQQVAESAQWFCLSGNLYSDVGPDLKAFADYNRAIELRPDYYSAYLNRGFVKARVQDYRGAIADYNRTIELKPDCINAYFSRGLANYYLQAYYTDHDLRDFSEAFADYNKAIELEPNFKSAYTYRAFLKERLNDYAGAIIDYDRVIQLAPGEANGYFFRGGAKNNLKDYAGAITDYDRALELRPNSDVYGKRADLRAKIGDTVGATEDREKAAELLAAAAL